jgi:uncharacterized Zn finger protein
MSKKEQPPAAAAAWRDLTWDDLDAWAGPRSLQRGRSYQRTGHVRDLARCADGSLLAWVQGQQRYATHVELRPEEGEPGLLSRCTCPLGISGCKHAVAIVVDYLDALKRGRDVPVAKPEDPRLRLLGGEREEGEGEPFAEEESEYPDEEEAYWDDVEEEPEPPRDAAPSRRKKRREGGKASDLRAYLEGLPAAELVDMVLGVAGGDPEFRRELANRAALAGGNTGELVRQARKEITRLTSQEAWYNHWEGSGNLPNYGVLQTRLEQLLEHGQADAVVDLGKVLFAKAIHQVGSSHDEGETAGGIAACLEVASRAVLASSRPDVQKLLYTLDMVLGDDYDICQGADVLLEKEWSPAVWSEVADDLARRLRAAPAPKSADDDFHARYGRDRLSGWLLESFERAGRDAEVVPLMEAEARATGSYERLVRRLIADGRLADAQRWAAEGIERMGDRWAGTANHLREILRGVAEQEDDWITVAAIRAEDFFHDPGIHTLDMLQQAADKAGCGAEVRAAALHFLETGIRPRPAPASVPATARARRAGKRTAPQAPTGPAWPLPTPAPHLRPKEAAYSPPGPHFNVLLELALLDKRPDEILRWYDRMTDKRQASNFGWGGHYAARVADAVADTHPERALALYREIVEADVAATSPSAYEAALPYLRKVRALLHRLGRDAEWGQYVAGLREKNRRKRRFMEVLDRLESRPIVEG